MSRVMWRYRVRRGRASEGWETCADKHSRYGCTRCLCMCSPSLCEVTRNRDARAGALRRLSRSASRVLAVGVIQFDEELRHVEDKR